MSNLTLSGRERWHRMSRRVRFPWPQGFRPGLGGSIALLFCAVMILAAVAGPALAPFDANESDFAAIMLPPAWLTDGLWEHPLGTDQLGRDVLSRLIVGTQIAMIVAIATSVVAGVIGVTLGLIAGYLGGWADAVISRVVDAFLALPFILMALAFISALGTGVGNILLVLIMTNWAPYARLVRSEVVSIKRRDFVVLAQMAGVSRTRIILRHILPNAANSILVLAVLDVGRAVILESSLSFLGLGIQPPDVSWGLMLADGRAYISIAWWLTVLPGIAIVATVLSFNAVGEKLRVWFDPRGNL
ncbi:ABC transporter permease [Azospirillum doebereinerae]|uniref:ABC transporter permease n=1 Tax=Azospirillum doebereinerae TaxID=92933 RepID=UPI001EE5BDDC|nr:ABC transporter permease [Azospirillum doebereinerae]MCG5242909.1 ABC transporter permease [Azospirillum doebereinerae]